MLAAYLDDTGTHADSDVVGVAGFLMDDSSWCEFDVQWLKFLSDFGLLNAEGRGRFKAAPYAGRFRPYDGWSEEKHTAAGERVKAIMTSHDLFGVGTLVSRTAFAEWREGQGIYVSADPFFFCMERTLDLLIKGIKKSMPPDDGVAIYVDQDDERNELGRELSEWHQRRLQSGHGLADPNRPVSTTYASAVFQRPLQAADVLAHSLYQRYSAIAKDGDWNAPLPPFLEALSAAKRPVAEVYFDDPEHIAIDIRARWGLNLPMPVRRTLAYPHTDFGSDEGSHED